MIYFTLFPPGNINKTFYTRVCFHQQRHTMLTFFSYKYEQPAALEYLSVTYKL